MAPRSQESDQAPQASTTNDQPKARVRRRPGRRNGPPQLQFLTATDLSQFKDEKAMKSVRSQAMIQYRYKAGQQKQEGKGKEVAKQTSSRVPQDAVYPTASSALVMGQPSRYQRMQSRVPPDPAGQHVLDFEESGEHEETQLRGLIARFSTAMHIGDGVDPFVTMPQFSTPELDSVFLVRVANSAFVMQSTMTNWVPVLLSQPHMLLSATLTPSTWLDMLAGCSGDSQRTGLVKQELIGWINQRLRDPMQQFEDLTFILILHLLAGELWSCNEKTLHIHQSGIVRFILHRGGMNGLHSRVTAEVAAVMCHHCNIICETSPLPLFHTWEPWKFAPIERTTALPESPLFCPRAEFYTLSRDPRCMDHTYWLLCDMRDLTDLYLAHHAGLDTTTTLDVEVDRHGTGLDAPAQEYEAKLARIQTRLALMPSACIPGLATSNDWLYECCRIAAMVYMGAMVLRVPFSVAAEPSRNPILAESASLCNYSASRHVFAPPLTEALYEALTMSDTSSIWGDLSGVLYWVASIGAAAGRIPNTINMAQAPKCRSDAQAVWIRRCMIMHATRPLLLLVFQHPAPMIMAQRKLIKIQELAGSGGSGSARGVDRTRT